MNENVKPVALLTETTLTKAIQDEKVNIDIAIVSYAHGVYTRGDFENSVRHSHKRIDYMTNTGRTIPMGHDVCDHCGELFGTGDFIPVYTNRAGSECVYWCEECTEEDAYFCRHCGIAYTSDNYMYSVYVSDWCDTEDWCESCCSDDASCCHDCGSYFDDTQCGMTGEQHGYDIGICPDCVDSWETCSNCGDLCRYDECTCDSNGYPRCDNCGPTIGRGLQDYGHTSARPSDFHSIGSEKNKSLYLGIELETEANNGNNYDLADYLLDRSPDGLFVCKKDGSLNGYGCEIVFLPCTPDYLLKTDHMANVLSDALSYGATSHDNGRCGIHVHLSSDALGTYGRSAVDILINNHPDMWKPFSRRRSFHWCEIPIKPVVPEDISANAAIRSYWGGEKGHGTSVNHQHGETIEVRIMRGTLKLSTMNAIIEAMAGIGLFVSEKCKDASPAGTDLKDVLAMSDNDVCNEIVYQLMKNNLPWVDFVQYGIGRSFLKAA